MGRGKGQGEGWPHARWQPPRNSAAVICLVRPANLEARGPRLRWPTIQGAFLSELVAGAI